MTEEGVIKLADFNSSKQLGNLAGGGSNPLRSLLGFLNPKPDTRNLKSETRYSKPEIWRAAAPTHSAPSSVSKTRNPKPDTRYRGASLLRIRDPLGPCSRTLPMALGGGGVLMSEVTLNPIPETRTPKLGSRYWVTLQRRKRLRQFPPRCLEHLIY